MRFVPLPADASPAPVTAYDGVEAASNFSDAADERRYRRMVLEKSRPQAEFILDRVGSVESMLEVCCGNGRLLMAMQHAVPRLSGYDLAASRIDFARRWIVDDGANNVDVWVDDCCTPSPRVGTLQVDLVTCITGAFGYFGAMGEAAERAALSGMVSALRPGGSLFLELYTHPDIMPLIRGKADNTLRLWQELADDDPFRFSLSAYRLDTARNVLHHDKTFIARADGAVDSGRQEALKIHDEGSIGELIGDAFEELQLYGDWDSREFDDHARRLIAVGRGRRAQ